MVNAAERRLFWVTAVGVVVSDFVTKLIAESFLARRLPLQVIGDVVQFRLVYNEGAAFGLHVGDNSRWIFLGLAIVALDPALNDDLVQEGLAREVVNRVQRLRKEAGYEYTTRIELSVAGAEDVVAATRAFSGFVEGETLARRMVLGAGAALDEPDLQREVDIEGRGVTIALRRHDGRKGGTR